VVLVVEVQELMFQLLKELKVMGQLIKVMTAE